MVMLAIIACLDILAAGIRCSVAMVRIRWMAMVTMIAWVAGPALIIQPPKRVRQGTTVSVRVTVPDRGRLTLRTYGERGGLVAVGKGRPVVKGWRKVKLTIGPNTRLGTLRIVATHVRPQTRAVLTAANVTRVVKG